MRAAADFRMLVVCWDMSALLAVAVITGSIADSESNGAEGVEYLEVFCNPNAYATAFDAKVLITVHSRQGLKVTTEGRLSNLKGDVDTFLEKC